MSKTINEIQEEIVREFEEFDDWMDRYNHIIETGKALPSIEEQYKSPDHLIKGCQSNVWLHASLEKGHILFTADSDAIITKGIILLLIRILSDRTPQEILNADLFFINRIGLQQHLSPTRSNGLLSMIKQMRLYAIAYESKLNKP